ncbi:HlyD family secretion protein [Flavobacterium plurextorum]|uniref:HlyD family secretion protein n=1 Tax=Flavobacterium TaxID=237 RepID=UPI00214D5B56|nr:MULTISPECIES: HlyD family secretion protein [Flavobacterium]UUW07235.1 HlyD family secretion protein [Flavobacterium plurextorum]
MSSKSTKYASEELQEISLVSNVKSYRNVLIFIISFIILAVSIAAIIKYPEKIIGSAYIVTESQINNIYAPSNGEIDILVKENTTVENGQLLALIKNPTNYNDLIKLKKQLEQIDVNNMERNIYNFKFEKGLKLGEIEKYYYNFLLALTECNSVLKIDISSQKIENIAGKIGRNNEKLKTAYLERKIYDKKNSMIQSSFEIDSSLYAMNAIVREKIDQSKFNILDSKEKELSIVKKGQELIHYNKELKDDILLLQKEKERDVATVIFGLKKAFFELKTAIDFWEHTYAVKATVSGKIEFYQPFLNSTQYVKKETPLFILLPKAANLYAKGIMSANGYGKIKVKDTVYIKLKDFPYEEYGELTGTVRNKSKVYHDSIYLIDIMLPRGLKTNHDKTIDFSYNMAGEVEYYTNKRSVLQRIFNDIQNSIEK